MTVKALKKKNNMKKAPFKLKSGNKPSIAKLAGVSPMRDKKRVELEEVEVSGGSKTPSEREKFESMKTASGSPKDKLTKQYGGTWTKKGTTWRNQDGLTAVQVAQARSRKKAADKAEYLSKN